MNWKRLAILASLTSLMLPSRAYACNFYVNSTFLRVPTRMDLGLGASFADGLSIFSGDLGFRAGDRAVVRPTLGFCTGGGESDVLFGGALGIKLWKSTDGKSAVNFQSGLTYDSFTGGNEIGVPLMGAIEVATSDILSLFGGAGIEWYHISLSGAYGGGGNETNPAFFGGVVAKLTKVDLVGGLTIRTGDNSQTAVNVAVRFPLGGGASKLQR